MSIAFSKVKSRRSGGAGAGEVWRGDQALPAEAFRERLRILRLAKAEHDEVEMSRRRKYFRGAADRAAAAPHTISLFPRTLAADAAIYAEGHRGPFRPYVSPWSARQRRTRKKNKEAAN
jgi:hypothetical protein